MPRTCLPAPQIGVALAALAAALLAGACTMQLAQPIGEGAPDAGASGGQLPPDDEDDGCAAGLERCDGACVDLTIDRRHCGACGAAVEGGEVCSGGEGVVLARMPTARTGMAATTALDGRIYVTGGIAYGGPDEPRAYLGTVEIYDPASNGWSPGAPMPTPRSHHHAAIGPDGRMYVVGGGGEGDLPVASVEVFDPTTGQWRAAASLSGPRVNFAAAVGADGRIYVFGGYDGAARLSDAQVYTPSADRWDPIAPVPGAPRAALRAATLADGRILVTGGFDGAASVADAYLYTPATGAWAAAPPLPVGRSSHALVRAPDGSLVLTGGLRGEALSAVTERMTDGVWGAASPIGGERRNLDLAVGLPPHALVYAFGGSNIDYTIMLDTVEAFSTSSGTW